MELLHHALDNNQLDDHEDVVLRHFAKCLEEDARLWFTNIPNGLINNWNGLIKGFMGVWC